MHDSPPPAWNPQLYADKHSYVYQYGEDLLPLLSPRPGERILDLGCGYLTHLIGTSGARVTGVDSDTAMIAAARAKYPNISFLRMDARELSFDEPFDAIFSNAVLHWISEPEKAVSQMYKYLKTGGRLVAEFGARATWRPSPTHWQGACGRKGLARTHKPRYGFSPPLASRPPCWKE